MWAVGVLRKRRRPDLAWGLARDVTKLLHAALVAPTLLDFDTEWQAGVVWVPGPSLRVRSLDEAVVRVVTLNAEHRMYGGTLRLVDERSHDEK